MLTLKASHISSNIKPILEDGFTGKVHSVFYRVVNIINGETLITVTDETIGDVPSSIRTVKNGRWGFNEGFIDQGSQVIGRNGRLIFVDNDLEIVFDNAVIINSMQTLTTKLLNYQERNRNLDQMQTMGDKIAPQEGLCPLWHFIDAIIKDCPADISTLSPMAKAGFAAMKTLIKGLRSENEKEFIEGVKKLTGLGAGLTPSGDDILTGLSGAYALLSEKTSKPEAMVYIKKIPALAQKATNMIAYSYTKGAVEGEITGLLAKYISTLTSGPVTQLETVSKALFKIGGTSGAELALGAYAGVCIFGETQEIV